MLTKEECLDALERLWYKKGGGYQTILKLIDKHFDNPPLTEKELDEYIGKPIWDNKERVWILVTISRDFLYYSWVFGNECEDRFTFEENRFFRKQVEE